MSSATTLSTLRTSLEEARGPSRELDRLIWWVTLTEKQQDSEFSRSVVLHYLQDGRMTRKQAIEAVFSDSDHAPAPPCTASIDAALAMVKRVLPGYGFYLRQDKDGCGCGLVYPKFARVTPAHCEAKTPALAICCALLAATAEGAE